MIMSKDNKPKHNPSSEMVRYTKKLIGRAMK